MAYKKYNGDIVLNLEQQVQKNKDDILRHYQIERVLADWGIRIIGRMDEWETPPTQSYEYGDAFAVGPDGGPFVFYIYTRGNPDYWFDYGAISIVGPAGPQGPAGVGERGERGSKWYIGSNAPTGPDIKENDIWLSTNGTVYMYINSNWNYYLSITGAPGTNGIGISSTRIENGNLIITYSNGQTANLGRVVGSNGKDGSNGITSLVYIIGALPEGSIISKTYDPLTQEPNAGVLMPVDGIQHVFIVVDGQWTNAGPYSGGSAVYANGEYQQTFDADTKLDKIVGAVGLRRVYGIDTSGNQTHYVLATSDGSSYSDRIPLYRTSASGNLTKPSGHLVCNTPVNPYQTANKEYVDNAIAQAHNEIVHATLYWNGDESTFFTADLGIVCEINPGQLPSSITLMGAGGYVIDNGLVDLIAPELSMLTLNFTDNKATIHVKSGTSTITVITFDMSDVNLEGTAVGMSL